MKKTFMTLAAAAALMFAACGGSTTNNGAAAESGDAATNKPAAAPVQKDDVPDVVTDGPIPLKKWQGDDFSILYPADNITIDQSLSGPNSLSGGNDDMSLCINVSFCGWYKKSELNDMIEKAKGRVKDYYSSKPGTLTTEGEATVYRYEHDDKSSVSWHFIQFKDDTMSVEGDFSYPYAKKEEGEKVFKTILNSIRWK